MVKELLVAYFNVFHIVLADKHLFSLVVSETVKMSRMLLTARGLLIRPSQLVNTVAGISNKQATMIMWRPSSNLSRCQSIAFVRSVANTQTSTVRRSSNDVKPVKPESTAATTSDAKSELDKPQWERTDRYVRKLGHYIALMLSRQSIHFDISFKENLLWVFASKRSG